MKLVKLCRNQWDRTAAVGVIVAGFVALIGGWIGASDTVLTFEQIPYLISGGLAAVCLFVLGGTLWLSADVRDEWRKLDVLEEVIREVDLRSVDVPQGNVAADSDREERRPIAVSEG